MTILYGQAGTENAIKSFEQAKSLEVFTWLTVFFVSRLLRLSVNISCHLPAVAISSHLCLSPCRFLPSSIILRAPGVDGKLGWAPVG